MNLTRLKELAMAATPGPWTPWEGYICTDHEYAGGKPGGFHVAQVRGWGYLQYLGVTQGMEIQDANCAYIAALSPDVALQLIQRLEAAESRIDQLGISGRQLIAQKIDLERKLEAAEAELAEARQVLVRIQDAMEDGRQNAAGRGALMAWARNFLSRHPDVK